MKAFVTGATGFLGSHVARVLAEQGAELRLLVRPTSDLRNLDGLNADRVVGDLRDAASISKALSGCDVVFHVAADYRLWVRDPDEMYRSNVEGTRSLLEAARKQGVRRVVYTSSVATMGFTSNHAWTGEGARPHTSTVADEESPVSLADMIGHYKRSKFMAEQVAVEAARSGVDVVIVNPTTPIGERDIKPTPTGRIVVDFLKRKFPAYVETGLNLVDATECARGHVQALEKGRSGERYILGGENLTLKQILDRLAAITGLPSPTVKLPYIFALAAGVVDEMVTGRLLGREPRATIDAVRMGRKMMFVSSAKAERELGWRTVPVDGAHCAGRWTGSGATGMSRIAIIAAMEREVGPLIRNWKVRTMEHGGRRYRLFENGEATLVCGGIGAEAARRATEAVIREVNPVRVISVGFAGALDASLQVGHVFEPRTVINAADGVRTEVGSGEGILVSSATVAGKEQKIRFRQSLWRECGGHGSRSRGARSAGAGSRVRSFESHLRRRRFHPARVGSLCGGRRELSVRPLRVPCGSAPVAVGRDDCAGAE